MALYGKTAAGKYRILQTKDSGSIVRAPGKMLLLGADVQLPSENIRADGTWKAQDASHDLDTKIGNPVRGTDNGLWTVMFDGASALYSNYFAPLAAPSTLACVASFEWDSDGQYILDSRPGDDIRVTLGKRLDANDIILSAGGSSVPIVNGVFDGKHVFIGVVDSPNGLLRVDGTHEALGDSGLNSLDSIRLGSHWQSLGRYWLKGWVGDFFFWNRRLNTREIADVETALKDRWGIV